MAPALILGLIGVWAGLSLGGALIAAPAKFRAPSLTRPVALEVGRAQFQWVTTVELTLCLAVVAGNIFSFAVSWLWLLIAVSMFAAQRFVLLPNLHSRTDLIIAGQLQRPSRLHSIYAAIEVAKFALLTAISTQIFVS